MEPFKVTFTFHTPVFIDSEHPLHLDSLIAYAVMREAQSMDAGDAWKAAEDLSHCLSRTDGEDFVWKASQLCFTPKSGILFENVTRKSDPDRYFNDLGVHWVGHRAKDTNPIGVAEKTFRINTRSGQHRGYQWLSASQWMERAEAWGFGDIGAVEYYLGTLSHVGKLGRNGYGRIKSIAVEHSDDADRWRLRVLPSNVGGLKNTQYEPVIACLRAPYWRKTDRVVAREPVA